MQHYIENNEKMQRKLPQRKVVERFTIDQVKSFKPILRFLNEKDRDILYLIFVSGKKQKDVQRIINRSQPSLCYDIKRIRKRLKFISYLLSVVDIFECFISGESVDGFSDEQREVMTLMFFTTSFTMVSEITGSSQVRVRYVFDKCLDEIKKRRAWEVYEILNVVRGNLNIIKRVYVRDGKIRWGIYLFRKLV